MSDLLQVTNLTVEFKNDNNQYITAVDDISFYLKSGEILGIVGESGSGKSVSALSILGLLPYPKAKHGDNSSIVFFDQELLGRSDEDFLSIRGSQISYIFQEPMSSLNPLHKIGDQIAETLKIHSKMNEKEAKSEVLRLLKLTGIQNAEKRMKSYPFELSGGQRQRVMIAMAIANNPKILIADEPTTALDVTVQEQIIDLLLDLKQKLNMSIIFISHDLKLIRKISNRVIVMKNGEIVEQGEVDDVFDNPKHSYTKTLISSNNIMKFSNKNKNNVILDVENLTVKFPIKKNIFGRVKEEIVAVDNLSIQLKAAQTLGVVGESGSGKSSLGLAIIGINKYGGSITYKKQELSKLRKNNRLSVCRDIQMVFQDPYNSLNPRMNVEEIVSEGLLVQYPNLSKKQRYNKLLDIIKEVRLTQDCLGKYPHEFSGGQRQRIAIARALILNPKILILDEPTSALDVTVQAEIIELLKNLQQKYQMSYIFISHDMRAIRAISDEIVVMKDGKIVEVNSCSEIFTNPKNEYTKKLINSAML